MKKRVMIVEEKELKMKLFRDIIEERGYEKIRKRRGIEEMEIERENNKDLIMMDIKLKEV